MSLRHGVVLLDDREIIFRIYDTTDREWRLFYYHSAPLPTTRPLEPSDLLEVIGNFFSTEYAQHIAEWKICSRNYPKKLTNDLSRALAIAIENISPHREQELICKGMFTELW